MAGFGVTTEAVTERDRRGFETLLEERKSRCCTLITT